MSKSRVATIAPWFCLRLPSWGPRFESQAHHLHFFQFVLLKLYQENNQNKPKEAGIGHFKKEGMSKFECDALAMRLKKICGKEI